MRCAASSSGPAYLDASVEAFALLDQIVAVRAKRRLTACYPRPIGTLPIVVGGSGEGPTLRIAAELAPAEHCASVRPMNLDSPRLQQGRIHLRGASSHLGGDRRSNQQG